MIKWLRKFSQCLQFDLQCHKDQKGQIFVKRTFGNVELKFCYPRGIYKCPKYKSGWPFGYR